ncbi:MAG: metalloregulator ArsR/SmtB family transcription factor [Xanthobacteraceae bacterium]
MKESQALRSFAALAQDTRLAILRLLVRAGPAGFAAGAIADEVGVSPSNLSFHLKELERAGLVDARREARSIIYSADYAALRGLIQFLTEDCCAGRKEVYRPAAKLRAAKSKVVV